MEPEILANCVRGYVAQTLASEGVESLQDSLDNPETLAGQLEPGLREVLTAAGIDFQELRDFVRAEPYLRLPHALTAADLPDTPTDWLPIPHTEATTAALLSIVLLNRLFDMETISYGSENGGALFVNLVTLDGEGAMAEKSRIAMKGHTDAASFPFRGTSDPEDARIAPSPDLVFLAALRNPDDIPTVVMPLAQALAQLKEAHVATLKGPNLVINSQKSFRRGTKAILGREHRLDGTNVLYDSPEGTWIRYTHSGSTPYDEDDKEAVDAKNTFEEACALCAEKVVLAPGDLLVVNNRKALHGRSPVPDEVGGQTRWLIRSYGMDTTGLADDRRYASTRHKLFP